MVPQIGPQMVPQIVSQMVPQMVAQNKKNLSPKIKDLLARIPSLFAQNYVQPNQCKQISNSVLIKSLLKHSGICDSQRRHRPAILPAIWTAIREITSLFAQSSKLVCPKSKACLRQIKSLFAPN